MIEFFMREKLMGRSVKMAKSKDKRLKAACHMPQGLRKSQPGKEYDIEQDEVLRWIKDQPGLIEFLFNKLYSWGYIRYDPQTGTWGGTGNDD